MKTILVAFDNSAPAARAAKEAAMLARRLDARLRLAYVVVPTPPLIGDFSGAAALQVAQELRRAGERIVGEEAKRLADAGVPLETAVLDGRPADTLAQAAAQDADVTMVVVGRSGHGAIAHVLLGSVVNRLLAIATKPVLVVP
jgi:nucleotide-binding universal stress UspA family protein